MYGWLWDEQRRFSDFAGTLHSLFTFQFAAIFDPAAGFQARRLLVLKSVQGGGALSEVLVTKLLGPLRPRKGVGSYLGAQTAKAWAVSRMKKCRDLEH